MFTITDLAIDSRCNTNNTSKKEKKDNEEFGKI